MNLSINNFNLNVMNKQKNENPGRNDHSGKSGQQPERSGSQMGSNSGSHSGSNSGKSNQPDKSHQSKGTPQNPGNKTGMREDTDE
jgi:hypothetical protein